MTASAAFTTSGFGLFHTTIKPGERHPGAAARAVVLDEKPSADALHPHSASIVVLVAEREGVALRCDVALEGAVMEIARGGNEYPGIDVQFPAAVQIDLDKAAAHIALTLAPGADPVRCLR